MVKKNAFLLSSIVLHLIIIYVLAQSIMFPSDSSMPKPEIIQAKLIFDLPTPVIKVPDQVLQAAPPQPIEPAAEPNVIADAPVGNSIEATPPAKAQATLVPTPSNTQKPKQEELEPPNEQVDKTPVQDKINLATPITNLNAPATSLARRHLKSFQQQQQNRMAEQAAQYYQQHKNSPIIDDQIKNPFMTEDEKLRESLKIRADCSSTSKKTAAVVLGLLGGQIDCSTPPPINSFIQNRINKQSHLPERHQQKVQKIPQSVVIKEQP